MKIHSEENSAHLEVQNSGIGVYTIWQYKAQMGFGYITTVPIEEDLIPRDAFKIWQYVDRIPTDMRPRGE